MEEQTTSPTPPNLSTKLPGTTTPIQEKSSNKLLVSLLIFLLLIVSVAASYLFYQNSQIRSQVEEALNQKTSITTETESEKSVAGSIIVELPQPELMTSLEIPTNWQTYKDDHCGYEIKFPENWTLEKNCFEGSDVPLQDVCLKSSDFDGYLGIPSERINEGVIIDISCDKEVYSTAASNDINVWLEDCIQHKVSHPMTTADNVCQIKRTKNADWFESRFGNHTSFDDKPKIYYKFLVFSTNFSNGTIDSNLILSSLKFLD